MTTFARRLGLALLHLTLLVALWTTALGHLSERPTAVRLLTGVGTHVLNPVLTAGGNGVGPAAYDALQQRARANPNAPLPLPGIKVPVYGRVIVGQSFDRGTHTIYGIVAAAYYDGGQNAALALPPDLSNVLFDYAALRQFSTAHGTPVTLPQIPAGVLELFSHIGLSASTLTQAGHDGTVRVATLAWIASLLLGLLVFLLSRRWGRLFSLASALTTAALPGLLVLAGLWFLVGRDPTRFPAVSGLATIIFGAFLPVYLGAFLVGLAGQVGAGLLKLTSHPARHIPAPHLGGPRSPREPSPVPVRAYAAPRPEPPMQSYPLDEPWGYAPPQQYPGNASLPPPSTPGSRPQQGSLGPTFSPAPSPPSLGVNQPSGYPGTAPQQPFPGGGHRGQRAQQGQQGQQDQPRWPSSDSEQ